MKVVDTIVKVVGAIVDGCWHHCEGYWHHLKVVGTTVKGVGTCVTHEASLVMSTDTNSMLLGGWAGSSASCNMQGMRMNN